jgi:hypothetical protein
VVSVVPGYFATFGAGLVQGRDFTWTDDDRAPRVAVVSRRFAERHFAGASPMGRRLRLEADSAAEWATVVGVVPDLRGEDTRDGATNDRVYFSLMQTGDLHVSLGIRTAGDPLAAMTPLREAVRRLDPDVPLFEVGRLDRVINRASVAEKVFGGLFSVFGISALVMACVGLFGMVAFAVRQRTRELGIRVALGARPASVMRLVMRGGLVPLGSGLIIGLGLALVVAPLFGDALMGANARDWRVYSLVITTLAVAGGLAAWLPSRRVLRVAPAEVLREE